MMRNSFIVLLFLIIYGCKKNDEIQLPYTTHTGANTFGCKINGETFVTSGDPSASWSNSGVKYSFYADSSIAIDAKQESPKKYIYFRFKFNSAPGIYHLNDDYQYIGTFTDLSDGSTAVNGGNEYNSSSKHTGTITVTNYDGHIIAGTFSFDAVNDSGQLVHITEGRFDIKR
ncbi:MAG: DUF6252 family protein [Chitinophagaceae bacterium]